uniref:CSON001093 protein n=1 Tax=Culicoides sonorensis TaxID=179676 RepID=A0A336MIJ4_CULSO
MHIHPSSPNSSPNSEDDAAARIQAGFRGYRVRKQLKQAKKLKENKNQNGHSTETTSSCSHQNEARPLQEQQRGSVRTLEEASATKIQAGIRGFLVRKRQKLEKDAAVKIQANFRGFKTRKDLNDKRSI